MGLFSFGTSTSRDQSQMTSRQQSFGFGASGAQATGASFGQQFVSQEQAPFLDFLRNQAVQGFGQQQGAVGGFQQALGGLGQQAGQLGAAGANNPFLSQLQGQAGGNPALVAAQTGQLSDVLAQQFNEQLNPAISRQAQGFGQLGGGRQGVAQGLAIQGQQRALAAGNVGFQQADAARAQQAALGGGQLFGQGIQQGFQGLGAQAGFLGQGLQAQFQPGQQLAQLIGGPTVLSQQQAFDQSSQFGFDVNRSSQFAQSTSSGRSSGINFGFGATPLGG